MNKGNKNLFGKITRLFYSKINANAPCIGRFLTE